MHAMDLAKLQKQKFSKLRKYQRPYSSISFSTTQPSSSATLSTNQSLLPKPPSNVPINRLSASRIQERREKGLGYTSDQKVIPSHEFKSKLFLLVHQDDVIPYPLPLISI